MSKLANIVLALAALTMPTIGLSEPYYVSVADDLPLAVTEAGKKSGPEILFLHGLGQSSDSFIPQMQSDLLKDYNMVAFDLRGHGMSGKPWKPSDYNDSAVWAADVKSVMAATELKKPFLVAWSYGTLIAADYIRTYGTENISGLILVSSLGGLVESAPPRGEMPATLLRARALLPIPDVAGQIEAVGLIAPMLVESIAAPGWLERARIVGTMVPPYVQPLLRSHPASNSDLVTKLDIPVLIIHGGYDGSVTQDAVASLLASVADISVSRFQDTGHSPFAENPVRFNCELKRFVSVNWKKEEQTQDNKSGSKTSSAEQLSLIEGPCAKTKNVP